MEGKELFGNILGKHLKHYREKKNITLERLAGLTGLDDKHLGKIERGKKLPNSQTLFKLQTSLDFSVDTLFHEIRQELESFHKK